jgi:DNA primase
MQGTERIIIHLADIPDARLSGGRLRAGCPVHGSNRQRSLSIQPDGDYAGSGHCFACGAEVLVAEMNPDWTRRLQARGQSITTAERLLRPVRRSLAEQQPWQKEELEALQALDERMRAALARSEKARAYLAERRIPLELAERQALGYIPPEAARLPELCRLHKWVDRLIFPLQSPVGQGYAGRSLHGWHPGMDENAHKVLLDALADQEAAQHDQDKRQPVLHRRWEKTYPAGWFGYADLVAEDRHIILVEGPFDRLALLAASFNPQDVLALVGSKDSRVEWLPERYMRALIALDGDTSGQESAQRLAQQFYDAGLDVAICVPPDDGLGKDWSERWRRSAHAGVETVFEDIDKLMLVGQVGAASEREWVT